MSEKTNSTNTFKRDGWTNSEVAHIIKTEYPIEGIRRCVEEHSHDKELLIWLLTNELQELIKIFSHHFALPREQMGAFARIQETGEIVHIGPGGHEEYETSHSS